jgi:Bacterial CdiA-CT RNAse A domain
MADEGLSVVLTPAQLASVLEGQPLTEAEVRSNRIWGAVKGVAGIFEIVGGGLLLVAPEPTGVTKVGGVVLGAHGIDTTQSGFRQAWSGHEQQSLTQQGVAALARELGTDEETASRIGLWVDIAVPVVVSLGVGAARIAAIRGGRIVLAESEAVAGSRVGGHTILKHIGKSEAELRARLVAETRIPAASTFKSLEIAERILYKAVQANKSVIKVWAKSNPTRNLVIVFDNGSEVGQGVVRATGALTRMNKVQLVFKFQVFNGKPYYILTSYPVP